MGGPPGAAFLSGPLVPRHSSFRALPPCAQKRWPPYWGLFVSRAAPPALGSVPHAPGATPPVLVLALSAEDAPLGRAWFLGERSSPPILPFAAPPPSPAGFPAAKRRLYRGPPRATKVQQLLIFGVPPPPCEAGQGGSGLLPTSVKPGGPARFSPDFRVLSQKMGRRGLARGVFRFLRDVSPPAM